MMKLNRYDIVFKFLKGKELVIAYTLSRAYIYEETETRLDILRLQINSVLNDSRLQEIREATAENPDLQELIDTIQYGWPDQKCSVKDSCKHYFHIRDNLSVYEGIVIKGESIVITRKWASEHKTKITQFTHIMKHLVLKCEKDATCQFEALLEQKHPETRYRKSNRNDVQKKNTPMLPMLSTAKEENDTRRERQRNL